MTPSRLIRSGAPLALALLAPFANAQEKTKESAKKETKLAAKAAEKAKPAEQKDDSIHTVKAGEFKFKIAVDGTLMPSTSTAIIASPERFTSLRITSIKPNASWVKKGEPIVTLDLSNLKDQIDTVGKNIEQKKIALLRAENDLAATEKLTPITLKENKQAVARAKDDLSYLIETTIPLRKESAERQKTSYERRLAYNKEELDQLEKMYTDDDLTEETEEMVLKRSRWAVEGAEFELKEAEVNVKRTLEVTIPRQLSDSKEAVEKSEISLQRAEIDIPASLDQKKLEVAAASKELADLEEAYTELKKDLDHLGKITAPTDGVLLYGDWTGDTPPANVADLTRRLDVGSSLTPFTNFATVASVRPGHIAASLPEAYRSLIGWRGYDAENPLESDRYATLAAASATAFAVGLESISPTLQPDKTYAVKLNMPASEDTFGDDSLPPVVPGMNVRATLVDVAKSDAITVPPAFIQSKFENGNLVRFVYLLGDDGKTAEQPVTYLNAVKEQVEILSGLEAGDKISKVAK